MGNDCDRRRNTHKRSKALPLLMFPELARLALANLLSACLICLCNMFICWARSLLSRAYSPAMISCIVWADMSRLRHWNQSLEPYLTSCTDNAHWLSFIASSFYFIDALISNASRYCCHDENLITIIFEVFFCCANSSKIEVTKACNVSTRTASRNLRYIPGKSASTSPVARIGEARKTL